MTDVSDMKATASDYLEEHCLPLDIPEIVDNVAAVQFVKDYRSSPKLTCPRCASRFTKRVNSKIFLDLSRCIDCGYMFNSLSGTIFQGTKLPIVKIIQAVVIVDSDLNDANLRDMAYALDVSYKTALGIQRKILKYELPEPYVQLNGDYSKFDIHAQVDGRKFAHYCAIHKIQISRDGFFRRVQTMLDVETV